ncbi:LmeA family phospholipid-binding protein [Fodinicola acaciae]|uniref:LmeA family phospholipid-binding protein n=1 Tax=Fodinicola acaciae TaxID=2681555 RepID=UPI0013D6BEE1|nr:DUF2993 domain-containing protein [Fodinicola acaciae]
MIILLVLLIVLVGALVAADRGTASLARDTLRTKLTSTLAQNGGTVQSVELEGFPFLTQVLGGKYDGMDARIVDVPISGLQLSTLTVRATDISWPLGEVVGQNLSAAVADRVDATAVLPLARIADPLAPRGIKLTPEGSNIRVNAPASFAGFSGVVSGLATPGVTKGELTIKLSQLTVAGVPLPSSAASALSSQLARFVKSPKLPYGLTLSTVRLVGSNLVITAGARQVRLGS